MQQKYFRFAIPFLISVLGLMLSDVMAQVVESENRRCRTEEEIGEGSQLFNNCPYIVYPNEASVSDVTFTTLIEFQAQGANYTERWTPQGFEPIERIYEWNGELSGWVGPCSSGSCTFYKGGWLLREPWQYFRPTLLAENVGTWVYEELIGDSVFQSKTFEVRELEMTALSGASQSGIVNQMLPAPFVVKLESFEDIGIPGEVINASISGPKGAKNAAVLGFGSPSKTNQTGIDQASIQLGSKPGSYTVTLSNRKMVSQAEFVFEAIDDIEDINPVTRHPDVEEGVGESGNNQCDSVGNPIGLSLGNKFQKETDLAAVGISPIEFIRYHNSLGYVSGSFQNYWTHTYDRFVEIPVDPLADPVKVTRPDGKKISFLWNGSVYQPYPGVYSKLEQTANGWRYTSANQTVENFDLDGRLVDITDLSGREQTTTHDRSGQLIRIDSNVGGSIDFRYDGSDRLSSISDQAGRTWNYRYEVLGRLQFVDNPDGTTREYHYEDLRHAYALTGITTENGQRFSHYEYDDQGLATASYHAGNANRVDIQYDASGDRIVLDPLGNATVYQTRVENKRGVLEGISGPICSQGCGQTDTQYSYDADLNIKSQTVYGVTTRFGDYDSRGQPGYTIQAVGTAEEKRIDYEYDPGFTNRPTKITEPSVYAGESRVTARTYDFSGNMLSETVSGFDPFGKPVSRTLSSTFNGPFGQITSSDGPRTDADDVTTYEYYPNTQSEGANRARLKAVVDPNGIRTRDNIQYSGTGKILSESRPDGMIVDYEYYAGNDRIKSVTESAGGLFNRTQWEYLSIGDVARIIIDDETGKEIITQFFYDNARRLSRVDSRVSRTQSGQYYLYTAGQWETYQFDDAGNIISETRVSRDTPRNDLVIDRIFDAYNRIDRIMTGGITEDFDYNPDGTLASQTDGNLNVTTHTYDAFKRLTRTEQLGQAVTSMTYDWHGNKLTVSDPENHTTQYLYDDLGNRIRQDSPDTGLTTYAYNASGQMLSQTDAKGQVSEFTYDAAGRLTRIDRAGTDYDVAYTFDDCTFGSGRICDITTGWGHTIRYEWNAVGELATVETNEGRIRYMFGPQNTLTSIEYPSGRIVRFDIDGGGLPTQVRLQLEGLPESTLVEDIKYSPAGRPVSWIFANGRRTAIDLDARHRPIAIDVPGVWNWQVSQYDDNDNILNLTTAIDTYSYGYDALDRLTAADTASQNIGFRYDAVGNRLSRTADGVVEPASYEPGSNRISAFGDEQYVLDPNGNTTAIAVNAAPGVTYAYSSHDRLVEITNEQTSSSVATYRYDALGQRVSKVTPSATRKFMYGLNGELLAEMDGAGRVLHEYVYLNGTPLIDLAEAPAAALAGSSGELIFDNDNAVVIGGNWQSKSSSAAENGSYLQNRKRTDRAVYWYVDETAFQGGFYDTYVKWLSPAGSGTKTTYRVVAWDASGSSESFSVDVDHAGLNIGDWVFLGNFEFQDRSSYRWQRVALHGSENDSGLEGAYLRADAVKLVPTSDPLDLVDLKFIHSDHLGTPQFVTDESGQVVWSASYLPFGEATVDEDPDGDGAGYSLNFRFPGQYYDAESGLHYNYFRTYNPAIGRFMESDPIGLLSDLNTFAYPDPIGAIDRFGLCIERISGQVRKTDWYVDGVWPIFSSARINDADRLVIDVEGNLHVGATIRCTSSCGGCDSTSKKEWTLYEYADFQGLIIPFITPEHLIPSPNRIVTLVRILLAGRKVAIFKQDANRLLESLVGPGADRLCKNKRKNTSDIRPGFP